MRAAALPPGRNRQESRHGKAPPVHLHERRTRRPNRRSPALNRPRPKWKPSCESSSSTTGRGTLPRSAGSSTASRSRNYGGRRKNRDSAWSAAIDIVLETMDRLFIGEAKLESALGSDSDHVLVHQLIRQYVMAHILLDVLVNRAVYDSREVVPFVVVEDADYTRRTSQIRFMVDQKWLRPEDVLSWHDVAGLTP